MLYLASLRPARAANRKPRFVGNIDFAPQALFTRDIATYILQASFFLFTLGLLLEEFKQKNSLSQDRLDTGANWRVLVLSQAHLIADS